MTTTLEAVAAKAGCDAIVDLLDGGSGDAAGDILWTTSADATIAQTELDDPAFGAGTSAVPSVATLAGLPKLSAAATGAGTVAKAKFRNKSNAVQFTASVGGPSSGEDIELSSVAFVAGDFANLTAMTFSVS